MGRTAQAAGALMWAARFAMFWPLAVALPGAWLLDLSRLSTAGLAGLALAVGLVLAGRRVTLRFAALGFGAALALGFTAMMLADLIGLPLRTLLEGPINEHVVTIVLAWVAAMLAGLGFASGLWAMLRGEPGPDDEPPPGK
jgi:hypothetical protein